MIYLFIGVAVLLFGLEAKGARVVSGFDHLYKKYASINGLDWKMLKAIAQVESNQGMHPSVAYGILYPSDVENSKSSDGLSWGLMQVTVTTARDYDSKASAEKLNDPEYSVKIASLHLAYLNKLFPGQVEWIVKSYNQGQGNSLKERRGDIKGYASGYWLKYMNAYSSIEG